MNRQTCKNKWTERQTGTEELYRVFRLPTNTSNVLNIVAAIQKLEAKLITIAVSSSTDTETVCEIDRITTLSEISINTRPYNNKNFLYS